MANKYMDAARKLVGGDSETKAAYWIGYVDGVVTTIVIGMIVLAVMS